MSIGPDIKDEQPKMEVTKQVTYTTKKILVAFFQTPLRYIYYTAVFLTFIGLYVGKDFSWKYWLFFAGLAAWYTYTAISENKYREVVDDTKS